GAVEARVTHRGGGDQELAGERCALRRLGRQGGGEAERCQHACGETREQANGPERCHVSGTGLRDAVDNIVVRNWAVCIGSGLLRLARKSSTVIPGEPHKRRDPGPKYPGVADLIPRVPLSLGYLGPGSRARRRSAGMTAA